MNLMMMPVFAIEQAFACMESGRMSDYRYGRAVWLVSMWRIYSAHSINASKYSVASECARLDLETQRSY